jgi:hypothetical protein
MEAQIETAVISQQNEFLTQAKEDIIDAIEDGAYYLIREICTEFISQMLSVDANGLIHQLWEFIVEQGINVDFVIGTDDNVFSADFNDDLADPAVLAQLFDNNNNDVFFVDENGEPIPQEPIHYQEHVHIEYTTPSNADPCPICYEELTNECWICEQCHHEVCRECCEHWFGSALEYALPADEEGPAYMLQAEQHNISCPYCRYELQ